ncbi:hypothetical protein HNY73_017479 [Argiope bruennichi]|uniref:Uncharacterized protein n=1 Tax=Argiope bruennichi TaxID=94029 RepID=A0A8T0EAU3_ARGBR|nr:hypothetical protein HNY73_017479 [Argiope bruennichi]
MTIVTLKDLINASEKCDEDLTQNLLTTIVEDRKANSKKKNYVINKRKKKPHIEEREVKLRLQQLRLEKQKRQDELAERKRKRFTFPTQVQDPNAI